MLKKGEQTKEHILICAEKVFSKKGYYESQVSDISQMAQIAKGTIYQYFRNKESLYISLIEKYVVDWENKVALNMNDFIGHGNGKDYARAYLRHRIAKSMAFFAENQDRANIILRMSTGLNDVIEHVVRIFEDSVMKAIVDDIKIGQQFSHISSSLNIDFAGNVILGGVLRISYFYFVLKKQNYNIHDMDSLTDEMVKVIENTLKMYQAENNL
ncbi:MAG TPA: TetR/AcrR family transcriptional regulator [Spirochaetota bacterium]|nr:TetR/AcrR family transcriptional regulator [Spirochaetota bacterium]HPJ43025.1 TetR/AcrR family transcriptional regulator [Spirochaetota bacterium]HPR38638.1 TetR/AcrR family transcriptional regulator [Spirochaetota bacterium]HRX49692.1 TetR/AcrR family transcriptional regulator [Spirochaetota bacterium]